VLIMSRVRPAVLAAVALAVTAFGGYLIYHSIPAGWLVIVIFGLATLLPIVQMLFPAQLVLAEDGFTWMARFPTSELHRTWIECSPFAAGKSSVRVGVQDPTSGISRGGAGRGGTSRGDIARQGTAIPAGFGGLNATALATLLNQYRAEALARPSQWPS
jgi:hypothetical protein